LYNGFDFLKLCETVRKLDFVTCSALDANNRQADEEVESTGYLKPLNIALEEVILLLAKVKEEEKVGISTKKNIFKKTDLGRSS
jgi:hypothetical protein